MRLIAIFLLIFVGSVFWLIWHYIMPDFPIPQEVQNTLMLDGLLPGQ